MAAKKCVTHHEACDCREERMRRLEAVAKAVLNYIEVDRAMGAVCADEDLRKIEHLEGDSASVEDFIAVLKELDHDI